MAATTSSMPAPTRSMGTLAVSNSWRLGGHAASRLEAGNRLSR